MMFVAPCRLIASRASFIDPLPNASSEMTEATPMMIPRTDRKVRSLCSHRLRNASDVLRRNLVSSAIMSGPVPFVALDLPVPHPDHPPGDGGDLGLVGHHDDRLAGRVQPRQHVHDLDARPRVQIAGR